MSRHVLHLLSRDLRVRLDRERIEIEDRSKGTRRHVPVEDIAIVVSATPDLTVTAGALRRLAEENVVFLVCSEKFEPAAIVLPYHRATRTEVLRRQVAWTAEWKDAVWREIVRAKIENQAAVLERIVDDAAAAAVLRRVARAARPPHLDTAEARAARIYWGRFFRSLGGVETGRRPGTRSGANGMLDYGYAVMRSAVLRSLAAHGFVAALGIHHAERAGSHALADDLVEPLRPFVDRALAAHLGDGGTTNDMKAWSSRASSILFETVEMNGAGVRLLYAIDLYVRSVADATIVGGRPRLLVPRV